MNKLFLTILFAFLIPLGSCQQETQNPISLNKPVVVSETSGAKTNDATPSAATGTQSPGEKTQNLNQASLSQREPKKAGTADQVSAIIGKQKQGQVGAIRLDKQSFELLKWSFSLNTTQLSIVDVSDTGELFGGLKSNDVLAINSGFFDTQFNPLGLVISNQKKISKYARTLGGGVFTLSNRLATLHDGEKFVESKIDLDAKSKLGSKVDFAVQCRPRLVVDGEVNIKSDNGRQTRRTVLCIKNKGRVVDAYIAINKPDSIDVLGPSLKQLAEVMQSEGCEQALNLDGGPSTGAIWRTGKGINSVWPFGPVRQAIVFSKIK